MVLSLPALLPLDVPPPSPTSTIGPWLILGVVILAVFLGGIFLLRYLRRR